MRLDLTDMLYSLSDAIDKVEIEILGMDIEHGKRVACLSLLMGIEAGFTEEELRDFVGCCILHDNAITEFIHEELMKNRLSDVSPQPICGDLDLETMIISSRHSVIGEQNIRLLPFRTDVKNTILYHHENADGSGQMGKTACETTLKSQILHLADTVDMTSRLTVITKDEFEELLEWIISRSEKDFSADSVDLFRKAVSYENILDLQKKGAYTYLHEKLPTEFRDYSDEEIRNIAGLFGRIVDYKSEFTNHHSMGVASKADIMARYYGFDPEKHTRYYFAGAMHDIGKLVVPNSILEKPGKLTDYEFTEMKIHPAETRNILSRIKELYEIVDWAANHHEKLNGSGYPAGLSADELSFEERLMACIDIYQALTEKRPYKDGIPHDKTISIMLDMVKNGEIDGNIVHDIDIVMSDTNSQVCSQTNREKI